MKHSDSIKDLATALAKAQGELEGAKKDSTNPHFKSRYADLASVVEALKAVFPKNGLSYAQTVVTNDSGVGVETLLMHSSGEWLRGEPFYVPVERANAQGFGSALTYCRRYSLAAVGGVAPDDDDGNAATAAEPRPNTAKQVAVDALDAMPPEEQKFIQGHATAVIDRFERGEEMYAHIEAQHFDTEEKLALWALLPSNVRSAIKKQQPKPALSTQG